MFIYEEGGTANYSSFIYVHVNTYISLYLYIYIESDIFKQTHILLTNSQPPVPFWPSFQVMLPHRACHLPHLLPRLDTSREALNPTVTQLLPKVPKDHRLAGLVG